MTRVAGSSSAEERRGKGTKTLKGQLGDEGGDPGLTVALSLAPAVLILALALSIRKRSTPVLFNSAGVGGTLVCSYRSGHTALVIRTRAASLAASTSPSYSSEKGKV